jgi:hypothetical protein
MTFHRPQPPLRNDHGDRLALDHGVGNVGQVMFGRVGELGALAELGPNFSRMLEDFHLIVDHCGVGGEQRLIALLGRETFEFLADLEFLQRARRAAAC